MIRPLLIALALLALTPSTASALVLGGEDDGGLAHGHANQVFYVAHGIRAHWLRLVVYGDGRIPLAADDRAIRRARREKLHVQVALTDTQSPAPAAYVATLRALMRRWPSVRRWSVWNEPDQQQMDACRYRQLYDAASAVIHAAHRQVLFGELSPFGAVEWTARVLACRPGTVRADGWAIHPYQFTADPYASQGSLVQATWSRALVRWWGIGDLPLARTLLAGKPLRTFRGARIPIYITEFGYGAMSGRSAASQEEQAAWWPHALVMARRVGARELVAYGLACGDYNWDTALLNPDGSPRPALGALAKAAAANH